MSISSSVTPSSQRVQNVIRLMLGLAVIVAGCASMISILIPRPNWDLVLGAWMGNTLYGCHKLIIVVGFFLLMLSFGIARGKRQAWIATILLLLVSTILQI